MIPLFPKQPEAIRDFDAWVIAHVIEWLYWLLTGTTLVVWIVLRIQNRHRDTPVRRALRGFILAYALVWASLLSGRWFLTSWRPFPFIVASVYAAVATLWVLVALARTYLWPRPEPSEPSVERDEVTGIVYDRRKGERRKNWPRT